MRKRIANLTSNILNPFLVSLIVILLLSFGSTPGIFDALKWSLILIAVTIVPVFLVTAYLVRNKRLDNLFIDVRKQRTKIYLLAIACAVVGSIILIYFGAPLILVAAVVAGLSAIVIFMGVNLLWKISLHTALIAASVTLLVILHGSIAAVTAALLPLIAWARITLGYHSLAQVATGAFLASLIVVIVFYLFGLV
ncbi:phosphatidic acid phosphatase [Chloroflexota bacterium]